MLKHYIAYIKQNLKPEHLAKMKLAIIVFCLMTLIIGPPPTPRLHELIEGHSMKPQISTPKPVAFAQIPPPELPYFAKE